MPVMTRNQLKNSINNVPVVNLVKDVIPTRECSKKNTFVTIDQAEINYIRSLPGFKNRTYLPGGVNLVKNVIPTRESSKKNNFVSIDQAEINYIRSLPGFKNRVILPGGVKLMKDCIGLTTRKCAKNISYKQFFDDEEIIINVCKPHFERKNGKVKVTHKWTKANANEIGDSEYLPEDEEY